MRALLLLGLFASVGHAGPVHEEPFAIRAALQWRPTVARTSLLGRAGFSVMGRAQQLTAPQHPLSIALYTLEVAARRLVEPTAHSVPHVHSLSASPMLSFSGAGMVLHIEY
jgi:hypothetical protein